jgi:hypothetical protein
MRLIDAYNLLVEDGVSDNHRYFSEVYKFYGFSDDTLLKDYLSFVSNEPLEWLKGLPSKLATKPTFSKPKTAIVKLLKKDAVKSAVGEDFAEQVHAKVWDTYKRESAKILEEREKKFAQKTVVDHFETTSYESLPVPTRPMSLISYQEVPTPPVKTTSLPTHPTHPTEPAPPTITVEDMTLSNDERVVILKQVILKLAETLPSSVCDAFSLLLERV